MKKYIGTKKVEAEPQEKDGKQGYKVAYKDGYVSWSPKDVFEEAYRECMGMSFGIALELLKKGCKVARNGWNGKGMFLYHVPAASYAPCTPAGKECAMDNGKVPYGAYITMKTAQGNVVPWLASQTDILAEDWVVVE